MSLRLLQGGKHCDPRVVAAFHEALQALRGLPILGSVAGPGTGTLVSLAIGAPVPRDRPIDNPHITDVLRTHDGEYSLFIKCAWRIEGETEVLCSSECDNTAGGPMLTGLARLTGSVILEVQPLAGPAHDLALRFADGLVLRVFCEQFGAEADDNYCLFMPTTTFTVGPCGALALAPRDRRG